MDISQFINFDFRKKWRETVWNVGALSAIGILLLKIGDLLKHSGSKTSEFLINAPESIRIAAFFIYLILSLELFKVIYAFLVRINKKNKIYIFNVKDWPDKWIFNGKPEPLTTLDDLFIKSSRAGCLLKDLLWKNFRMTFKMKYEKTPMKRVGVIFRAQDLENYFMLEIFREDYGSSTTDNTTTHHWSSGIKPHVRYKGGWEVLTAEYHEHELDFSNFASVVLEVRNKNVTFFYERKKLFEWILPTHVDVNHIETGFTQITEDKNKEISGKEVTRNVQALSFRTDYGMVGFRAHPGQGAIIRDLKIEPL